MNGFPPPSALARMSDRRLLAHLSAMADELDGVNGRQAALWSARIAAYVEARRRGFTYPRIAEASRVSEVAIISKLKQLDERATAAADL